MIDNYCGEVQEQGNVLHLGMYIAMFSLLVAVLIARCSLSEDVFCRLLISFISS